MRPIPLYLALFAALPLAAQAATITRTTHYSYTAYGEVDTKTQAPGDARLQVQTSYRYDDSGRPLATSLTGQNDAGQPMAARSSSQTYTADGRFIDSRSNALGQTERYSYHPIFGHPTSATAVDGTITRWEYDSLGRKVQEIRPDGSRTRWNYNVCSNCSSQNSGPLLAAWTVRETTSDASGKPIAPDTTRYYSAANLLLVSETIGFDGRISTIRYEYDTQGRLTRQSKPHFAGQSPAYTTFDYDEQDRVIKQTEADGSITRTAYRAGNGRRIVAITNALDQVTTRHYDSQGKLIEVRDAKNQPLSYTYSPSGELAQTVDAKGNTTTIEYDPYGRKTKLIDPNLGTWTYSYNSLGELVRQTDAKQQSTVLEYDPLGRLTKKSEADLISHWDYDSAANGIGKLARASTSTGYQRSHQYDPQGRPTTTTVTLGNDGSYSKTQAYDSGGRLASISYPTGLTVHYSYNGNGYLQSLSGNGKTYWQAQEMDAAGRITRVALGGGAAVNRVYNNRDRVELIDAGGNFKESYAYDHIGNLKTRSLLIATNRYQYTETFGYDALNRLTRASGDNPVSTQDIVYDELGNITYKSGVGNYSYPASGPGVVRPHAITVLKDVDGIERGFAYDANGNLLRNESRSASWTSYNLPRTLEGYGQKEEYWYDAEHERIKQVSSKTGTQLYFNPGKGSGLFYEKHILPDGKVEHKQYLTAQGEVIGEIVQRDGQAEEERYWIKDHLGSNRAVIGGSGQLLESLGFDAWGKRRNASGETDAANPGLAGQSTDRGYTGHEHLDELGLINMNARIYDPQLGRFLSPDPEVTDEERMQNYNRYAYVLNNPLSYTDPSGEAWWNDWGDFKAAIGFGDKATSSSNKTAPPEKFKQSMDNLAKLTADSRNPDAARVMADQLVKAGLAVKSIAGAEDYERELIDGFREIIRACGRSCADYAQAMDLDGRVRSTAQALRFNEAAAMGMQDALAGGGTVVASLKAASQAFKKAVSLVGNPAEAGGAVGNIGKLPKVPTGRGSVPPELRDPQRHFTPAQRLEQRIEQNHQCANCGIEIDHSNSAGHHIKRHADGGRTIPKNHAEVCTSCHKKIHSGG